MITAFFPDMYMKCTAEALRGFGRRQHHSTVAVMTVNFIFKLQRLDHCSSECTGWNRSRRFQSERGKKKEPESQRDLWEFELLYGQQWPSGFECVCVCVRQNLILTVFMVCLQHYIHQYKPAIWIRSSSMEAKEGNAALPTMMFKQFIHPPDWDHGCMHG